MKHNVAVFDFDGTLYNGDSFIDFAVFAEGRLKFALAIIRTLPHLLAWKLGFASNSFAKQKLFSALFKGCRAKEFEKKAEQFAKVIDRKTVCDVKDKIARHIANNDRTYIISASPAIWIEPWASKQGVTKIIATEIEVVDGKITGRFSSANCYGQEKVSRLLEAEPERDSYTLYAYGDSRGDKEMLQQSDIPTKITSDIRGGTLFGAGLGLVSFLFLILVGTGVTMLSGKSLSPWLSVFSLLSAIAVGWKAGNYKSALIVVLSVALSVIFGAYTFDTASDSFGYHRHTVIRLIDGWNYISTPFLSLPYWSVHYVRGQEIMSAAVGSTLRSIEAGKAVNMLFLLATLFLAYSLICRIWKRLGRARATIVATILIVNPVALCQVFTFYNDIYLYPGLVVMVLLMIRIYRQKDRRCTVCWIAATMISCVLINIKFSHFFYCGLFWAIFIVILLAGKSYKTARTALAAGAASLLIGVFIIGFNPYVTNTLYMGSPLYPLHEGTIDIMTSNTPDILLGSNRFVNFLMAQCSYPSEPWGLLKNPLNPACFLSTVVDARLLGFGPLFILLLVLSLVLMFVSKAKTVQWIFYIAAIALCFIFEQAWWARYATMAWATLGIAILCSYLNGGDSRFLRYFRKCFVILVFLNLALVGVRGTAQSFIGGRQWEIFLKYSKGRNVKVNSIYSPIFFSQLNEKKINYTVEPIDSFDTNKTYNIVGTGINPYVPVYEIPDDSTFINTLSPLDKSILRHGKRPNPLY